MVSEQREKQLRSLLRCTNLLLVSAQADRTDERGPRGEKENSLELASL